MNITSLASALLSLAIVIFLVIPWLQRRGERRRMKRRTIDDLTTKERSEEYHVKHLPLDVNRLGRWKVTYMDGTTCTRLSTLRSALGDHKKTFSPVVKYRELV